MKANVKIALEIRQDHSKPIIVNGEKVLHEKGKLKGKQKFELCTENVPLFADIRFAGTRMFYFTGYRIDSVKFDNDKQEARKNTSGKEGKRIVQYNIINKRLDAIRSTLVLFFQGTDKATKIEVIELLDGVCKKHKEPEQAPEDLSFYNVFQLYIDIKVSDSKQRHVKSVKAHWERFDKNISFEGITVEKLRDFQTFLETEEGHQRGKNTVHSMLKTSRAFWNWARLELKRKGIDIGYPFGDGFSLPGEDYGKPIYLTIAERDTLFNKEFTTEKLQRVRDIFVFQCLIGARVGDLCKMTKANIQNNILSYIPRKTKDDKPVTVTIPLHPKAVEILSRYDIPGGALLPYISDQRYNDYIKDIFEEAELNRIVTRLNPKTGEPEQIELYKIASSHMARRAFVGNLYGKVDNGIISSMSGHVPGSKSFTRYYDVSEELQLKAINFL